jgi:hypothetical protein
MALWRSLTRGVTVALFAMGVIACPIQAQSAAARLKITVLEGDNAINNIGLRRAKQPIVEVQTEGGSPVEGALVSFVLPSQGPGGAFAENGETLTVTTDSKGQAAARGLYPNKTPGQFQIRVVASYQGQTATTNITQTNAEPTGTSKGASRKIAILALVGGAVAGGAFALASGGKGSSSNSPATVPSVPTAPAPSSGAVITPGNPSFGPP